MPDSPVQPQPGDSPEEFVVTFAHYEPHLRAFIRSTGFDWEHVDEVMQSVSLVLWRKWSDFDPATDFMKWARVVARFEILKYRRQLARDRHVFDDDLISLLAGEAAEEEKIYQSDAYHRALEHCLEKLPASRRKVLLAAYQPGQKIRQIAEGIGQSATALYKSLRRSREQLHACIEGQLGSTENRRDAR